MDTSVRAARRVGTVRRHDWRQYAGRRQSTAPPPLLTARWVPPGESVRVHGHDLPDGMIFVGRADTKEPSCIDPDLAVGGPVDDRRDLGFWPSYETITPAERAAYLRWLSAGRRTPDVSIGYVFLFFYGLERRVVQDRYTDQDVWAEVPLIESEVRALLEVYGEQPPFRRYATAFLDLLELIAAPNRPSPDEFVVPERGEQRWPPPMTIRRALSAHVVHGRPIPAAWALAWAWHGADVDWAAPTARWGEFEEHFASHYQEQYGEGRVLRPTKRQLRVKYEPASEVLESTAFHRRELPEAFGRESRRELTEFVRSTIDDFQPSSQSTTYAAAVAFVELAMALSGKDGLADLAAAALRLDEAERAKLDAHIRSLAGDLGKVGVAGGLAELSATLRATVGELLIQAAATGRLVLPRQISELLASYTRLGLDPATVPRLLQGSLTGRQHPTAWKVQKPARDPVVVRKRDWAKDDYLLPKPEHVVVPRPPKKKPAYKPLDTALIQAKLAETATVSALLHDIFTEEPEPEQPAPQAAAPPTEPVASVAGLDAAHSALLRALAARPTWSRDEFDGLAGQHGLLPAGALDVLNEAALETADDLVLLGDDDLELDPDVLQELLS
ncbi:TerB N- and C- terminal domain-containing protein [Tenggerimyces flavus]|uniref:TerB N-terminal domain-containing protein n=1 Tax=Tenggerimyces flavus TaxID=1708749 RepID=A0ABV7Y968_9ACTN|nr:TerB N-terminal domain-containing protein [Tenggerimyces flavus]MBM7785571.1 hypothetical protein [Tenggerimyces flavus]